MITITISGPQKEPAARLASKLQSWLQVERHVVRKYEDESALPEEMPTDADYVIIVKQETQS